METPLSSVSSNQLVLETEGAEPGSISVDGSSQAERPTKVRDIMRTLLTREEWRLYAIEARGVNSEAHAAQRLRARSCDAASVDRLIAGVSRQSPVARVYDRCSVAIV
jgi:hypothetical protein